MLKSCQFFVQLTRDTRSQTRWRLREVLEPSFPTLIKLHCEQQVVNINFISLSHTHRIARCPEEIFHFISTRCKASLIWPTKANYTQLLRRQSKCATSLIIIIQPTNLNYEYLINAIFIKLTEIASVARRFVFSISAPLREHLADQSSIKRCRAHRIGKLSSKPAINRHAEINALPQISWIHPNTSS